MVSKMASSLPKGDDDKPTVDTFGIGMYDDSDYSGSSSKEHKNVENKKTVPDGGGPLDPFGPDRLLGYPSSSSFSSSSLPGDYTRPPSSRRPEDSTLQSVVHSVSQSKLPQDENNPASRSSYFDHTVVGKMSDDLWSSGDAGAYGAFAQEESLPSPASNFSDVENFLNAIGNYWSGRVVEDQSVPYGHPSVDRKETSSYPEYQGPNGGTIMASDSPKSRVATNFELVGDLSKQFISEYGKKNLTRRHVIAFLSNAKQHQYLASDIIRCLKLRHGVFIKDVLTEFPVYEVDAKDLKRLSSIRDKINDVEVIHSDPKVSKILKRCASELSTSIALLKNFKGK